MIKWNDGSKTMTVGELISELQKHDTGLPVVNREHPWEISGVKKDGNSTEYNKRVPHVSIV